MIAALVVLIWLYLVFLHGKFYESTPELASALPGEAPGVDIVVPARDEEATIGPVVASLLAQDYPGPFRVIVVNDGSTDATAARAIEAASGNPRFVLVDAAPKPRGWSGKLWAVSQGVARSHAEVLLFADADIVHEPAHLSTLVARLLNPRVDMVSEMVRLNCESFAERALIPAFVYFFQLLYPFSRVNDPLSPVAAAAGGTVLIRRTALERIGGIDAIRGALIDDVTLARAVKKGGPIYLGHSRLARSIRPYPEARDIFHMVARTAFTELRYSALRLVVAIIGLALVFLAPLWLAICAHGLESFAGLIAWLLSAYTLVPTLRRYRVSPVVGLALPAIAVFYMAATISSAFDHWRGKGASWKNRAYP
jgi:hopene-associated glycosyltransferase HpnB